MTFEIRQQALQHANRILEWRLRTIEDWITEPELALVWCHFSRMERRAVLSMGLAGVPRAHACLCGMAEFLTRIGDPLPSWLQEYVISFVRDAPIRRKRGRSKSTNALRDVSIVQVVAMVTEAHDLQPTRNPTTCTDCVCSIVSEALAERGIAMTEANVAAIWARAGGSQVLLDAGVCEDPCLALLSYYE